MYTPLFFSFFFFNDTATTEIYTLSLHDALPIYRKAGGEIVFVHRPVRFSTAALARRNEGKFWLIAETLFCCDRPRSEEHTSELQSRLHLVCRLLLEKKKKQRLQQMYP